MKYTVVIAERAANDVAEGFAHIHARSPMNAERWIRAIYGEIDRLEEFCGYGRARESEFLGVELRQKVFKSHRIIFSIDRAKKRVVVQYVRHAARRAVGEPDEGTET